MLALSHSSQAAEKLLNFNARKIRSWGERGHPQRLKRMLKNEPRRVACYLDRRRRIAKREPEEEWRDPEDVCTASPIQGILSE